jgi:hypothetical protein
LFVIWFNKLLFLLRFLQVFLWRFKEKDLRLLFRLFLPHRPECVWALMWLTR